MKVAVVGSRTFNNYEQMIETLDNLRENNIVDEIISGGARGADALAEQYAREYEIKMTVIKPDWSLGRHAGILRNTDIIAASDLVVAFYDGHSRGTADSIKKAKAMGKSLIVVKFD
jgi:predicted Rossmann fold nucleotide-binding protein DprA/Smf involved in DNA uptake